MELARAAGWQLRSCSGNNNSCCPPAHLSSIRPDPIPIQFQIQSGQWLARLGQIESDSRIRAAHRRDAEAIFHAIWSNACGVSAFTRSVVASSGAWSDRQSSQSPSRPFPASSSSAPRLRRWRASARRCGGSTSPSTTGSSSSDGPLPPLCAPLFFLGSGWIFLLLLFWFGVSLILGCVAGRRCCTMRSWRCGRAGTRPSTPPSRGLYSTRRQQPLWRSVVSFPSPIFI